MTTLKDRIKADITEAMKAREEAKLSTLRMVLSAIQNAEVAGDEAIASFFSSKGISFFSFILKS